MIQLVLPGAPTPQGRPRMLRTGGVYNPQAKAKTQAKTAVHLQLRGIEKLECGLNGHKTPVKTITGLGLYDPSLKGRSQSQGALELTELPLHLDVTFHMPIPKSWSLKKRAVAEGSPHVNKPDCDNLIKFILDVLTGIVYADDRFVWSINARKVYSSTPRTHITLSYDD